MSGRGERRGERRGEFWGRAEGWDEGWRAAPWAPYLAKHLLLWLPLRLRGGRLGRRGTPPLRRARPVVQTVSCIRERRHCSCRWVGGAARRGSKRGGSGIRSVGSWVGNQRLLCRGSRPARTAAHRGRRIRIFRTEVLVFIFLMQSCEAPLRAPFGPPRALPSTRTRST